MFRNILFLLYCVLCCNIASGQLRNPYVREIKGYAYHADTQKLDARVFSFTLDSTQVTARKNENVIKANSCFKGSGSELEICYYLKNEKLVLIDVAEKSPKYNDLSKTTAFYMRGDTVFAMDYHTTIRPCLAFDPLKDDFYGSLGYNKNLDSAFLKLYTSLLLQKMKDQ